ncbi:MAG: HIT domain-containing protein [Candidatus Omnitrophica bacterium]|nr:HIT domain-containing protein [Candidatus Omnitrophota bacterium]
MDKLWAPWRIKYITSTKKQKSCIFCQAAKLKNKHYVVFKTKHSVVLLNIFPYNNGHLMVCPIRHIKDLTALKQEETLDLFDSLKTSQLLLQKTLRPEGFNIGINLSKSAGAGITGHMHIHIVPRWRGDTNFMPVIGETKIISQSLKELLKLLKDAYKKSDKNI